jgi:hypothetical protein
MFASLALLPEEEAFSQPAFDFFEKIGGVFFRFSSFQFPCGAEVSFPQASQVRRGDRQVSV